MSCSPASEAVMSLHKAWRAGGGKPEGYIKGFSLYPKLRSSMTHQLFYIERHVIKVMDKPSSDCKVVLHCWSLSPGSAVGKKTAAGIPVPAESRRKPTAISRACQPGTPPTLFSTLCWDVYMEFRWPFCILWRDFSTCKRHHKAAL